MVSLKERSELATFVAADPHLKRFQTFLMDGHLDHSRAYANDIRESLLSAIADNNRGDFAKVAHEIGRRSIGPDADWCFDDYLLFLLLLGKERFSERLEFISQVIEARRTAAPAIAANINNVFGAIARREFEIEGPLCFLKIPFLRLCGRLELKPRDAQRALGAMNECDVFQQLSPFLKLLMLDAHDTTLTERRPFSAASCSELVDAIEELSKRFTLADYRRIIWTLPIRAWLIIGPVVLALIPILFGFGSTIGGHYLSLRTLDRPSSVHIGQIRNGLSATPDEVAILARSLGEQASSNHANRVVLVESEPLSKNARGFAIEVSHANEPIEGAIAFTSDSDTKYPVSLLLTQRDGPRWRAIVPTSSAGQKISFLLRFDGTNDTQITNGLSLRPVD